MSARTPIGSAPGRPTAPDLSCETVERRLATGPMSADVAAHLRRCPACREDAVEGRGVRAALAPLAHGSTRPDALFVPSLLARVRTERSPVGRREHRHRRLVAGALAASLLIAVFSSFGLLGPEPTESGRSGVQEFVRAEEFPLGSGSGYLPAVWIPAAPASRVESGEVRF